MKKTITSGKTVLGYHTFSMSAFVESRQELNAIKDDFKRYRDETGLIGIQGFGKKTKYLKDDGSLGDAHTNYNIFFHDKLKFGVSWALKFCNYSPKYRFMYIIEARINPKILTGTGDHSFASSEKDFEVLQISYNKLVKSISDKIPLFPSYVLRRVDYCINADIEEMGYPCTAEEMMELIKRCDVPLSLNKGQEYSETGRRLKDYVNGFSLQCASYNVNCYYKHFQLMNEYSDDASIESSKDVIRFEVQCSYLKTYNLKKAFKDADNCTELILSDKMSDENVTRYFSKTIMLGDYYSLNKARKIIESKEYCSSKQKRLIDVLELIATHKGIYKAREHFGDVFTKAAFDRSLKELVALGINPVTIPRNWKYDYLPNLLKVYRGMKESSK